MCDQCDSALKYVAASIALAIFMNILYTNFHSAATLGGHSIYILSLLSELAARHNLSVAVPEGCGLARMAEKISGVKVFAQAYPSRFFKRLQAARQLRRVICEQQIDVIHVNGSADHRTVMQACRSLGRKRPRIIFTKHNDLPISPVGATLRARLCTDHVIGVCHYVGSMLQKSPYACRPISIIANGVCADHFQPWSPEHAQEARQALLGSHAADCRLLVGSNAGTNDYKGWMDMVQALALLKDQAPGVYVALAGAYPNAEQQQELQATGLAERVIFTGPLDDVRPFLAALDLGFVLSYRVETISFACREMMAMGLPVVVSDQGGLPENITPDRDGWIVPRRDPQAVAKVMSQVLQDPSCLKTMGQAAREKSKKEFTRETFARQTEQVYLSLVGADPIPNPQ